MIAFTHDQKTAASESACENLLPFVVRNLQRLGVTKQAISEAVTAASDQEYGRVMLVLWSCGITQEEATTHTTSYVEAFKEVFEAKLREQLKFED